MSLNIGFYLSWLDDNDIVVLMIPPFEKFGLLPPGVHWVEWDEFAAAFGFTPRRQNLLVGLKAAIDNLTPPGVRRFILTAAL